jgi:hypothetical protein
VEARQRVQLTSTNRSRAYPIAFTWWRSRHEWHSKNTDLNFLPHRFVSHPVFKAQALRHIANNGITYRYDAKVSHAFVNNDTKYRYFDSWALKRPILDGITVWNTAIAAKWRFSTGITVFYIAIDKGKGIARCKNRSDLVW